MRYSGDCQNSNTSCQKIFSSQIPYNPMVVFSYPNSLEHSGPCKVIRNIVSAYIASHHLQEPNICILDTCLQFNRGHKTSRWDSDHRPHPTTPTETWPGLDRQTSPTTVAATGANSLLCRYQRSHELKRHYFKNRVLPNVTWGFKLHLQVSTWIIRDLWEDLEIMPFHAQSHYAQLNL